MKLKIGDIVEFKKYEDMSMYDTALLTEEDFPKSGKVTDVKTLDTGAEYFCIEGSQYNFNSSSVARVISDVDGVDINSLNPGDEVLVRVTIKKVFNGFLQINPLVDKTDVTKILKRKEPKHFIVKENYYNMYIGTARKLVSEKSKAKVYTSCDTANEDARSMPIKDWELIPYDD